MFNENIDGSLKKSPNLSRFEYSLWKVDDLSTSIFMDKFYYAWVKENKNKAEALQYAQLSVKQMKNRPFYWAPFILVGDWK